MLKDETIKVEMIMFLEIGGDDQGGDDQGGDDQGGDDQGGDAQGEDDHGGDDKGGDDKGGDDHVFGDRWRCRQLLNREPANVFTHPPSHSPITLIIILLVSIIISKITFFQNVQCMYTCIT